MMIIYMIISALLSKILRIPIRMISGRKNRKNAAGFFHPYTNDGGGGERVLWCAVKAIQDERSDLDCVIYTGDHDASPQSLMARATDRFGVHLINPPKVCLIFGISSSLSLLFSFVSDWGFVVLVGFIGANLGDYHVGFSGSLKFGLF